MTENCICDTCQHKRGKVYTAPISKKRVAIFSCSSAVLVEGYDYDNNQCSNYEKE